MNDAIKRMNQFLNDQIELCRKEEKSLQADSRKDEADFQKIKANVYDIFRTILSAAQKAGSGDLEKTKEFFLLKAEQIPANWKAAYETAKLHDDTKRMVIEELKLNTIEEIKKEFLRCWEETK